jgi:hypothetical protein
METVVVFEGDEVRVICSAVLESVDDGGVIDLGCYLHIPFESPEKAWIFD